MRKITILMLLLIVVISAVSCGSNANNQTSKKQTVAPKSSKDTSATVSPTPSSTPSTSPSTTPTTTEVAKRSTQDYRITDVIHSEALKNNVVGENVDRNVYVYLPPSYFDSEKKYPVLYYLHGHSESAQSYFASASLGFDKAAEENQQEFIVVFVDGAAQNGGAFYVNSEVSGNWEDYVVNEVVTYVDSTYRTLANRDSRGIFGFSMGGFGALNLALNHPDVFGATFSMSPGVIAKGDIELAWKTWAGDNSFLTAYGRAFSPNTKDTKKYANIPTFDGSKTDNKIIKDWENGFGNFEAKIENYLSKNVKLRGIKIQYGKTDYYSWIPRGCEDLAKLFKDNNIECEMVSFEGGHNIKQNAASEDIAPFFAANLVAE